MFETEPVLTPEEIEAADDLDALYDAYVAEDHVPGRSITGVVDRVRTSYDEDELKRAKAYETAASEYWDQVREDVGAQEGLATERYDHDGTAIEVIGVIHGFESAGPVPLYHGMGEEVEQAVHDHLERFLEEGSLLYEEGIGDRLPHAYRGRDGVRGFWDVTRAIQGDDGAEQAAQSYLLKELSRIPVAKLIGRVPYRFSRAGLDQLQTSELARRRPDRQQDAANMIEAESMPVHLQEEYLSIVDKGEKAILTDRSTYMAERLKEEAERTDADRVGGLVGMGHMTHIIDWLERDDGV